MFSKKLSIRTQQEEVANLTSFSDKSIFQINTSNTLTSNSLIFEVGENNGKIKLFNQTNATSEIFSFNNNLITISSNVTINNTLNVSNLNVIGSTTTIDTTTYETENLHIINTQLDGPSLKIEQSYEPTTPNNILDVGSLNSSGTYEQKMVLDTDGNLNITGDIDFDGNLTNSGNTLIYNQESLKTFLSGKNVTTLNLSQNGEIKINDEAKKFHWSYDIDKSDVSDSIYYSDTNLLTDIIGSEYGNGQSYKSHVNITADIGEGKYTDNLGFLIQNRERTNAIGFGYNTISQVGNEANGYLNIKSKGNLPVQLGNETNDTLQIYENRALVNNKLGVNTGVSTLIVPLQVGPGTNTSGATSRSSVAILSGDSGGATELCALSLINSRQGAIGTACSLGFNLSNEWGPSVKINAISTNATLSADLIFSTHNGTSLTEKMRIHHNGNVGIGVLSPTEKLTITGDSTGSITSLGLRNGNDASITNNGAQISFGWNGSDNFKHFIQTRHNNTITSNAIDFYVCDGTQNNTVTSGSTHTMSLVSGKVGIGSITPTKELDVIGDIRFTGQLYQNEGLFTSYTDDNTSNYLNNFDTHIIPDTDNAYDIGSVDKRIKELFVSNNSIWMGDTHKIVIKDNKMKFKKINKNVIPTRLQSINGVNDSNIFEFFNNTISTKEELTLSQWLQYGKSKDNTIETINDIFEDDDNNFEQEISTDIWQTHTNNIYLHNDYQNIGIGVTNPLAKLHVHSTSEGDGILISEDNAILGKNSSNDKTQLMFWNGSQVYYGRVGNDSTLGVTAHNFRTSGNNNNTVLRIVNDKVGIGIDSPKSVLNVHNTLSGIDSNIRNANSGSTVFNTESLWLGKGDSNNDNYWGLSLGTIWAGSSYIQAVNTGVDAYYNLMLQPHGGNVGINNQNPQYSLDVTGDIKFTGKLYQGNSLFTSYTDTDTTNLINTGVVGILKLTGGDTFANTVVDKIEIESYFSTSGSGGAISFKNKVYNPSQDYISARIKSISNYANDGSIAPDNYYSGHLIFETQFGDSANTNGVSRNTTERMRITNRGNIGIGTTNPTHKLDVNGDINYTGKLLKNGSEAAASGTIYKGMIVEMKHNDYKKMKYAAPAEWSPIDNDLSTGFLISIKPKSLNSLISLFVNCYISFDHNDDARWWGARLYRKVGNGNWTHVTGAGGNRTGDDADDVPSTSGTAVWFGDNNLSSDYSELGNCSASYLDTPNTLETVYYTVYWKCRLGGNHPDKNIALNRSISHGDAFRAEPISSWTVKEIWNDGNPYSPVDTTISISADNVGINNTNPQYELDVTGSINFTGVLKQNGSLFTSFNDQDAIDLLNTGFGGGLKVTSGNVGIGTTNPQSLLHLAGTGDVILRLQADTNNNSGGEGYNPMIEFRQDGNLLTGVIGTGNLPTGAGSNDNAMYLQHCGGNGIIFLSGPDQDNQSTSTERMRISTNGNIGIGTITPSKKLDVNGDVNISGTLTTTNLDVTGLTTTINTQTYQTENLEIINTQSDGPSLSILQNNYLNNIIDTSNLSTDKKFIVDNDGFVGINIIPTTELDVNGNIKFTGNINNVSATTLSYIQNLDEDIITKISETSNLLDNKSSNFTNTIYNELNNKIDNINVDESTFILDGSQIISGFVNATSIPIDNFSLYIDNGLLKVNPNNDNTELNTFIGKYEKTEEYIETIDTVLNSVTTVDNRIFYETTTLTSNITITNNAPKFFTSQTIYPRDIYNRTVNYTSTTNQWVEGVYTIITNSSDGVFNNNYDTYGSHKVFSHNLTEFYKSTNVFDVTGNYIGTNNFKGTIGLSISIDIGRLIYLRTLKLFPNTSTYNTAMPENFKIYASNNTNCWDDNSHSSWNLLYNNGTLLQYKENEFTVFGNFDNLQTKYRFFTLVVTKINGNNEHLELNELSIIGVDDIANQALSIDNETNTYAIKLEYEEVVSETYSEVTIDGTQVSNYSSTNNLTVYNDSTNVSLTFNTESIVYDEFDNFTSIAEWDTFAKSLGGSTYFNTFYPEGPFYSSTGIGYITFPLPNEYNFIVVEFDKTFTGGRIQVLLNNTAVLTTATGVVVNNVIYTGVYSANTTFKFQEMDAGVLPRNLKVTLINKKEYTLNFLDAINTKVNYTDQLLDTQYTLINGNFDTTNRILNTIIKKTSDNSIVYYEETLSLIVAYLKTKYKQEYNILPPYLNSDLDYLYSYYTFENDFNDSKNSYNLINNNNCVINYDNRLYDNCALYLNGNANIELPDNINLYNIWNNGDGLTISFWFNMLETTQTYGRMLEFAYQSVKYNTESTHRLGIMKNIDDNNSIQIYWKDSDINDKGVTIQLENSYNNWNHLSFSVDKSGFWYIYLNGKLQSIDATPFQPPNITYNVKVIGRSSYSTTENFHGYIDDLRFYGKVLDQKEVKILYESIYQTIYTSIFSDIIFADILLVAGGGSGGGSTGGGGGSGGILYTEKNYIPINNYIFRIGKGGDSVLSDASHNNQDGGIDGINTIVMDTVVFGGGGGGGSKDGAGNPGGSGGGGAFETAFGGSIMTPVYGYVIINGKYYGNVGVSTKNSQISGDGGGGIFNYTINSVSEYYGGVGKGRDSVLNTTTSFDNSTTLGGGGGGGGWLSNTYSGKGGNGIVIIKYYLDKNETQEYSIETNDNYKVLSGDKVLLNSTLVRRVYNTGDKYFTVYNIEETDIETNIGTITTFVKLNNILKFNITNTLAEHVVYYSNAQNYTKVVIPRNDIYKININAIFNLEFANEFCKFYIKLERLGYEPRYLREFYLPPISEYSNNDSSTLDVTVDLELLVNDVITFESNYKLSEYKDSFLTITSTNKTIIDGTLIQNIYNTSANEAFTFESPLNKLGNTITLDQSQLTFNINFAQPLVNNNNTVSVQPNYYANYTHNHDASDIVSGQLFLDRIPDLTSRHYSNIIIDDKLNVINTNFSNITTYENDILKLNQNVLPIATTNTLGCIKVDDTTINVDEFGVLSSAYNNTNVSNYLLNLDTHIIPATNETIDIGSVDKKIRDIYVSNNSIWMGETHKLMVTDNKLKFKKRNKNVIPSRIKTLLQDGGHDPDIAVNDKFENRAKSEILLHEWLGYAKELDSNIDNINVVFEDNNTNYEEQTNIDFWLSTGNNIYLHGDYQNIGIGTTTPSAKLHIIGHTTIEGTLTTSNLNVIGDTTQINTHTYTSENLLIDNTDTDGESIKIYHRNATQNIVSIYNDDETNTSVFTITNTGKVGIGITNPSDKFEVNGSHTIVHTSNATGGGGLYFAHVTDSRTWNLRMGETGNNLYLDTYTTSWQTRVSYLTNGNVGIGISTPSEKLHVNGNTYIQGKLCIESNSFGSLQAGAVSIGNGGIDYGGGQNWNNNVAGLLLNCNNNTEIAIHDSNSRIASFMYYEGANNRFTIGRNMYWGTISTIALNGNIGIGTSSPTEKLTIDSGNLLFSGTWTSNTEYRISCHNADKSIKWSYNNGTHIIDNSAIMFEVNNNERMKITNNGNIGIGTNAPQEKIDMRGSNTKIQIYGNSNTDVAGVLISANNNSDLAPILYLYANGTGSCCEINSRTNHPIKFLSNNVERMIITNDGKVGIGTMSPGYKLEISGDINISGGDFYKDGVLFTGGGGSTVWQTNNNDIYYDLGNVGIGTLTPAYTLDVIDNVSTVRIKSDIASGQGHSVLLIDSKNTGEAAIKLATNSQETWKLSSGTSSQLVNNSILVDNAVVNSVYNIDYQKIILGNDGSNQQTYQLNFQNDMKIDILIVGGGGGGYGSAANYHVGGGGGGGAILYATDLQVTSGTYTFKVGKGGDGELAGGISAKDGFASEAFGAIANGGGKGKYAPNYTSWYGGAGGTTNTLNTTVVFTEYNGGDGGTGTYSTSAPTYSLSGADGPLIDIVGSYYWGGGGGGGGWYGNFGSGGEGGGAGGGFYNNGYYGPATGGTGINNGGTNYGGNSQKNPVAGSDGGALTGGGGGGAFRENGGSGGSGSIIIVYKTTDIIYTPDTNLRLYNSLASSIFSINQNGNLDVTGDINLSGDLYKDNTLFSSYSDTNFDARFNTRIAEGLQITGTANNVNTVVSANLGTYGNHAFIDLRTNSNSGGWIDFGSLAGEDYKVRIRGHNEPRKIEFYTSQNVNPEMYLDTYGDLYVNGNITAYYSDERLKTVTENVKDVLNTLNNVDVFKYKRNDLAESLGIKHTKQEIGLSAQQINKYYPEVVSIAPFDIKYDEKLEKNVSKSGENYLTLNYERLVPILLQGIKELNNKNIKLENQLKDMKQDIEDIKKYINK